MTKGCTKPQCDPFVCKQVQLCHEDNKTMQKGLTRYDAGLRLWFLERSRVSEGTN